MKYKVWDYQLNQYAFGEYIFNNKREAVDQIVSFFSVDNRGCLIKIRNELWGNNEFAELFIQEVEQ